MSTLLLGIDVCDALGLDPNQVQHLNIRIAPDDIVTVEAMIMARGEQGEKLAGVLAKYKLVEVADNESTKNGDCLNVRPS